MLTKPTKDPVAVAAEIERIRRGADLYWQAGLAGLIGLHGQEVVERALGRKLCNVGNVVIFPPRFTGPKPEPTA